MNQTKSLLDKININIVNWHKLLDRLYFLGRILSLAESHSPPYLPRVPSNMHVLVSGPAVGAVQILIRSCLQCPQQPELVCFLCGSSQ